MNKQVGIEKIAAYPGKLALSFSDLAKYRNIDASYYFNNFLVKNRSLNPPYEDAVTMAVNVAKDFLSDDEKQEIGLLIVGTESGVDLEKSISSWVHGFLQLPSDCRNFEIKSACYCATASIRVAEAWIRSGAAKGKKALIINSDHSTNLLNRPYEFLGGSGAVAMLISDNPQLMILEEHCYGVYSHEITDVIRPFTWYETGNSQASLFSYMEALQETYSKYKIKLKNEFDVEVIFNEYFDFNIFHVPFPGISVRAFKQLLDTDISNEECMSLFYKKTKPALIIPQEIGGTYGGSIYFSLLSLIHYAQEIKSDSRIGIFSYGSGSCAEFYSCIVADRAKEVINNSKILDFINNRTFCTVEQYEECEIKRTESAKEGDYLFDKNFISQKWFETNYCTNNLLILDSKKEHIRVYRWAKDL